MYPIIMLTNERIVLVVVGSITSVHWLALLWDIWMIIWLGYYMVVYHEISANKRKTGVVRFKECFASTEKQNTKINYQPQSQLGN